MLDEIVDGVRTIRNRYTGSVRWTSECQGCVRYEQSGQDPMDGWFPAHDPMPNCESGGRTHCTCDRCF